MPNDLRARPGIQIMCHLPPDIPLSKTYACIMHFALTRELQKVLYFGRKCELFKKKGELKKWIIWLRATCRPAKGITTLGKDDWKSLFHYCGKRIHLTTCTCTCQYATYSLWNVCSIYMMEDMPHIMLSNIWRAIDYCILFVLYVEANVQKAIMNRPKGLTG